MRVTLESWALSDPALLILIDTLGCTRRQALGLLIDVWHGTQAAGLIEAPRKMLRVLCRSDGDKWKPDDAIFALSNSGYIHDAGNDTFSICGNARHVDKLQKAKNAAKIRWNKQPCERIASAMQTQSDRICERNAYSDSDSDSDSEVITSPSGEESTAVDFTRPSAQSLINLWNENCGSLPRVLKSTPVRLKHARARLIAQPDLAHWRGLLGRLRASPFCTGQNARGWLANFDWFVRPETHVRILEGQYDHRDSKVTDVDWSKIDLSPTGDSL